MPRLISARWLRNHGVLLRYAGNGAVPATRWVAPDGALTVGEAARLLGVYPLQVYRLERRGRFRFRDRAGVATVPLAALRGLANGAKS